MKIDRLQAEWSRNAVSPDFVVETPLSTNHSRTIVGHIGTPGGFERSARRGHFKLKQGDSAAVRLVHQSHKIGDSFLVAND